MSGASPQPTRPVRRSVVEAMDAWQRRRVSPTAPPAGTSAAAPAAHDILQSMPRRAQLIERQEGQLWLPYHELAHTHAGQLQSLLRLFAWLGLITRLQLGNLLDRLLRRDSLARQAVRLRQMLERGGGTFVKFGQQAAMRIDLLPWEYCVELSKMLDQMLPFPVEQALLAIDRAIGRPWQEVFTTLDPKPVGSGSIACVYQATLKNGEKVVVKVRRPGIEKLFMADLRVLDWIMELAEFLTFFRPGFTHNLRVELREILLEELDFRHEARFQDIFGRNAPKSGKDFFNAPRVYFEYSNDEVLVQEFITGLWLWEVIAAVEQKEPHGRALLRELNIDPAIVARRILWSAFWSMDEHVFFHADPHPANILVRPNNQITFIDFGSCGSFNNTQRIALEQMVISMKNQDVETMARASLGLMEPLPPVDLAAMLKLAQEEYMRVLHTFNTPAAYTEYWERTSARQWIGLINVAQKFNIPMNLHTLRMIRATLLYDSIVLRLDRRLDRYEEYTLFMKDRAEMIKQKWKRKIKENAGDNFFLNLEDMGKTLNDLMIRTQSSLGNPVAHLSSTVDKWIFAMSVISRTAGRLLLLTVLAMLLLTGRAYLLGLPVSFNTVILAVLNNGVYQGLVLISAVFNIRHILFRMKDRD